jgi:hypothetical protein
MSTRLCGLDAAIAFCGVAAALILPPPARAASPSIAEVLAAGWDTAPDAREAGELAYQQFVKDNPGNRQVLYAYALVKMQQRQFPEAVKLLDQYLAIEKNDLHAWRAKSFLSMLLRQPDLAIVELDKLSQVLADDMAAKPKAEGADGAEDRHDRELHGETVSYLGRMIGFLEGPAEGSVNAATLTTTKTKISNRLSDTWRDIFDSAASAVIDEYNVLATAKDDAKFQEIATAEKAKRDRIAEIERLAIDAASRQDELKAGYDKVQEEIATENATYARQDQPLADELSRLSSQAAVINRELSIASADIFSLRRAAEMEQDQVQRLRLLQESDRLERIAVRLDADLRALERRAAIVQRDRAALALRHRQNLAAYGVTAGRMEKEFKTIETSLKRAESERAKLKKPATGNTGKVIALNKQAIALTTYEVFPLEAEKQRLLDELAAP